MSTENEGAATTPAAGPNPTSPTVPKTAARDGAPAPEATDSQGPSMSKPETTPPSSGDTVQFGAVEPPQPGHQPEPQPLAAQPPQPPHRPEQPPMAAGHQQQPTGAFGDPGSSGGPEHGGQTSHGGPWGHTPYGGPGAGGHGAGGHGAGGGPEGPAGPQYPWGAPPAPPGPPPGGKRLSGGLLAAVLVAALVAGGIGGGIGFWAAESGDDSSTTITSGSDPEALNRSPKSVAGIAAKTLPSVVTIETSGGGEEGTGTGFVFDKQGHILTNNHVVASGGDGGGLSATFSDGKKYEAEVVGKAQGYDVAVIKLKDADERKLRPLPLGRSNDVQVGDATIAIGAPFGLSGTVTTGIVSAKNRPVASSDGQGSNASYMNALQTDASINPGNSGGPLLNAQGAVIGVNSAIQSAGGEGGLGQGQSGSIGLGFAIPVNQAKRVATQLIKTGTPVYPVIGATVTMDQKGGGAVIADRGEGDQDAVTKDGPADKAGLKPGDVITKLDDTTIDSGPTLIGTIWTHKPGEKVKITYERDGKEATTDVTLGSRKGDQ
ncbi:putative serine protease PepD [Streptomyces sp. WMMB 714]|uniref:S1C family serine protease n=1 Tax=Streptomyces sp. WMMB 714 TaxID=1286822 RepID=UPI0005F7DBBB|nr:trypsin-like peptidase domain-containing protein [Streptomyces sp. WMMB 714]SCK21650.1 putative serine protease PepD [Streptomyces sp. WMMB 714]